MLTVAELRRLIQSHVNESDATASAASLASKLATAGKDKLGSCLIDHLLQQSHTVKPLGMCTSHAYARILTASSLIIIFAEIYAKFIFFSDRAASASERVVGSLAALVSAVEERRGDFEANFLEHLARAMIPPQSASAAAAAAAGAAVGGVDGGAVGVHAGAAEKRLLWYVFDLGFLSLFSCFFLFQIFLISYTRFF